MKIVFMGTPHFAVAALKSLVENGYEIAGVITAADKPAGRGRKLQQSAVKEFAVSVGLTVLQPTNLKNDEFLAKLKSLEADLFFVVAFRMLPAVVFEMPPKGTINLHASLLPQYRGAAPINWAIIKGETETGVTTFFIEQQIDTGKVIAQKKVAIEPNDTAGSLHDKLMHLGAGLVIETAKSIEENNYTITEQDHTKATKKAPKIFKEDCTINWNQNTNTLDHFIRGMSPYPTAFTLIKDQQLKIYTAVSEYATHQLAPGEIVSDNKTYIKFATKDGFVVPNLVQLQGKRKMEVRDFLNGFDVEKVV